MAIKTFRDKYAFLSNFYYCTILYEGIIYPSSEHAFQAAKTININDREIISKLKTPSDAKKYGKLLKLRSNWEFIKKTIMYDILKIKFSDSYLKQLLLQTGNEELIEGNWWNDTYWGICNGTGENNLGKILMRVRQEIQ